MYFFTADTIVQANKNIEALDPKVGGLLCLLSCLPEDIEENISYTIDGERLRKQLSVVFDKEPKDSFENAKASYIIFAKDWASTFFDNYIKNRVDLLSCAVFFLRRNEFERQYTSEEIIDIFVRRFNLTKFKDRWFFNSRKLNIAYNQNDVEDNQSEFYIKMQYAVNFKSILFRNVIQKSAADLKAAGQIQTLYSGSGIHTCLLLSDEPLDQYYIMSNTKQTENDTELEDPMEKKQLPTLPVRTRTKHALNNILYGAPGTGKTYSTAQYALAIIENKKYEALSSETRSSIMARYNSRIDEGRIVFTTFHQNYGYEDFIQGIRPDTSGDGMAFKTVDGVFKKIANEAMKHPEQDYVLIIDEINRANISKVFGELITLIEADKRWGEINAINATLPSGEPFAVPNNLYILGTMNSADKSISLIDTALRRRFDFVEFEPNATLVSDLDLRKILIKLNEGISSELGSTDLLIGHSYFMQKTINDLCEIMNRNIIPLLYEYFFDNQKKVEAQVKAATDGYPVEVKAGTIGRIKLVKKGLE